MKKVLALVLVAVLAMGMGMTTFAKTITYVGMEEGYALGLSNNMSTKLTMSPDGSTLEFDDDIRPVDEVELKLDLVGTYFVPEEDAVVPMIASNGNLSASEIRASKIVVRTQIKGGSKAVESVSLDSKKGQIVVKFVEELVSTSEQDFELFVYLTIDGKRFDENGVTIIGTVANEVIEVFEDFDYVELAGGYVAEAIDFNKGIEVDLGNGVSIFTKLFKGKKYYGTSSRDADDDAAVVFAKYPDVDNVVTLKTVGLNSTGDIVKLDTDYANYFVYDKDMNYLGQANEMLPYSTKYYLANRKLDIADDEGEPEEEEGEEPGENPNMGGDEGVENVNANPGTGR